MELAVVSLGPAPYLWALCCYDCCDLLVERVPFMHGGRGYSQGQMLHKSAFFSYLVIFSMYQLRPTRGQIHATETRSQEARS